MKMNPSALWRADLAHYKNTRIGRYIAGFMTRKVEMLRFAGQIVMWGGAFTHIPGCCLSDF
jgi:hypothetical protein